jgi:hypothetical protein
VVVENLNIRNERLEKMEHVVCQIMDKKPEDSWNSPGTQLHDGTLKMSAAEQPHEKEEEETWDDLADEWEEKEGVKEFAQQAYQSLISKLEISPAFRVLDFGLSLRPLLLLFMTSPPLLSTPTQVVELEH